MTETQTHLSDLRPRFEPFSIHFGAIPAYRYAGDVGSEIAGKTLTREEAEALLEDMLTIREFEEMIVRLRSGAYEPIRDYDYRGPTHVSVGQEATAAGACSALEIADNITSTHRGHGESLAKGTVALRRMSDEALRERVPECLANSHEELLEAALEEHVYRTIGELFGKDDGYCRGRGGGMHIADFSVGHLGANAIVGGGVPIATGAALASRYFEDHGVVCCFAGDGAYANGVVLESLNFAAQSQFTNHYADGRRFGLPIIFLVCNNHYGMTGRADDEVDGRAPPRAARRRFRRQSMHAEVVNGMDVLAVREAVLRAVELCRKGDGPVLIEADCYRYWGHSLSDPRNEYRSREEEAAWKAIDPIETYKQALLAAGALDAEGIEAVVRRVAARNARAARRAAAAPDPDAGDVLKFMYADTRSETVPPEYARVETFAPPPAAKRADGEIAYRDALREALVEEMLRDNRVVFYGEDVADYGGAFKVTKGLLETFGRRARFQRADQRGVHLRHGLRRGDAGPEAGGRADVLRLRADVLGPDQQPGRQVALHVRRQDRGAAGHPRLRRRRQGLRRAALADARGGVLPHPRPLRDLSFDAVRRQGPAEVGDPRRQSGDVHRIAAALRREGAVPEGERLVPIGVADVKREGGDITFVSWGPMVRDCLEAAERLGAEQGVEAEVVDLRSLIPLDIETVLRSVRKTGRCVVASAAVRIGSFTGEIASTVQEMAFDYLDAPVLRVGAKNGIAPQSHVLETAFLPGVEDIVAAARSIL